MHMTGPKFIFPLLKTECQDDYDLLEIENQHFQELRKKKRFVKIQKLDKFPIFPYGLV